MVRLVVAASDVLPVSVVALVAAPAVRQSLRAERQEKPEAGRLSVPQPREQDAPGWAAELVAHDSEAEPEPLLAGPEPLRPKSVVAAAAESVILRPAEAEAEVAVVLSVELAEAARVVSPANLAVAVAAAVPRLATAQAKARLTEPLGDAEAVSVLLAQFPGRAVVTVPLAR